MSDNLYTTSSTTVTGYINPNTYITTTGTSPLYVSTDNLTTTGDYINKIIQDAKKENKKTTLTTSAPINIQNRDGDDFKKVIEHVPCKVYEFEFWDGKHIKTICQEDDVFDFDFAFYLAAAKHIWGKELTLEGVLKKADELRTIKKWVKRVKVAKRRFFKNQEAELKAKEKTEQAKKQHKKYIEKKKRRDERRAAQAQDNLQRLITEAIKAAKEGE